MVSEITNEILKLDIFVEVTAFEIIEVILKLFIFVEVTANWEEVLEIPIRKYRGRRSSAYLATPQLPLPSAIGDRQAVPTTN